MSKQYQPQVPFTTPCKLLKRVITKVNGVNQQTYTESDDFMCSAKSYGGTEKVINDVYVIEDTWTIDTWFNPNIAKGDKIRFLDDNSEYEIYSTPENINRRGQYMRFKAVSIGG